MGLFGAEEGVDEGAFAYVGAAEEGDFRGVVGFGLGGEMIGGGGGEEEEGGKCHGVSLPGGREWPREGLAAMGGCPSERKREQATAKANTEILGFAQNDGVVILKPAAR